KAHLGALFYACDLERHSLAICITESFGERRKHAVNLSFFLSKSFDTAPLGWRVSEDTALTP
ncbi:MAG: hypothetical protein VX551_15060, partial [Pseudomonadota bacterium]|nr:hypothetical protein [Pseudomonadota bacterium]